MKKPDPVSKTIFPWLTANCGSRCLAALCSTDSRALQAAVQIIELYAYHQDPAVIEAFGLIVRTGMQPHTLYLAYHAIAHVLNWEDRDRLWAAAGLPEIVHGRCKFEPKEAA